MQVVDHLLSHLSEIGIVVRIMIDEKSLPDEDVAIVFKPDEVRGDELLIASLDVFFHREVEHEKGNAENKEKTDDKLCPYRPEHLYSARFSNL
ncbi:hypothetical protein J2Z47_001230 [Cohnella thailandensis]|nr:hypothetical protein [Cohnella thailandensis]